MKAVSGVLNTFETASDGVLSTNKFQILFMWRLWAVRQLTFVFFLKKESVPNVSGNYTNESEYSTARPARAYRGSDPAGEFMGVLFMFCYCFEPDTHLSVLNSY